MTGKFRIRRAAPALAIAIVFGASAALADMKSARESFLRGDHSVAVTEFKRLAEAGNADAQIRLGAVLSENEGLSKDQLVLAYKWIHLESMQGTENAGSMLKGLALQMIQEQIADAKRRAAAWQPGQPGSGK